MNYQIKPTLEIADQYFEFISSTNFVRSLKEIRSKNNISEDDILYIKSTVAFPEETIFVFRENLKNYLPDCNDVLANDLFFIVQIISAYCRESNLHSTITHKLGYTQEWYLMEKRGNRKLRPNLKKGAFLKEKMNLDVSASFVEFLEEQEQKLKILEYQFGKDLNEAIKEKLNIAVSIERNGNKSASASISLPPNHFLVQGLKKELDRMKIKVRKPRKPEDNEFKRKVANQLNKFIKENLNIRGEAEIKSLIGFILGECYLEASDFIIEKQAFKNAEAKITEEFRQAGVSIYNNGINEVGFMEKINKQAIMEIKDFINSRQHRIDRLLKT